MKSGEELKKRMIQLPLIQSKRPGSRKMITGAMLDQMEVDEYLEKIERIGRQNSPSKKKRTD